MGARPIRGSLSQRFFASDWPLRVWLGASSLGLPLALLQGINSEGALAAGWRAWLLLAVALVLFAVVGFLVGALLFSAAAVPILHLRARLNGGPFEVGDLVVVIGGECQGCLGCVYALGQGGGVWVEVGDGQTRFEVGQHQLLRQ